jgi:hypothetical protein
MLPQRLLPDKPEPPKRKKRNKRINNKYFLFSFTEKPVVKTGFFI